jgi:phosphoribosylpyrophosphate synthetase
MKTISERRENLVGAFEVPKVETVRYRSFLLIDDVMTSGATLQEAARVLRRAGARQVDAVVFARGINASKAPARIQSGVQAVVPLTFGQNTQESPRRDNEALRRKIH